MKTRNIILAIIVIALVVVLEIIAMGYYQKTKEVVKNPTVTMEIEGYGVVKMELYPDKAPNTVANFVKLVNEGYYNGLTFHRVIDDMLIQGGDKAGTGSGATDFAIKGEFFANGFKKNNVKHEEGTLAMARADYSSISMSLLETGYNSAGSQFYICLDNTKGFDGLYAAFGKVTEGIDIVRKISKLETTIEESKETEKPATPPVITKMTVDTYGVDYGEPERIAPFDYNSWLMSQYGGGGFDPNSIIIPE